MRAAWMVLSIVMGIGIAEADPLAKPSGYDCGADGEATRGVGCRCGKDKIEFRRSEDNWATCVLHVAPKTTPAAVIPKVTAKETTKGLATFEKGCDAKKGQDCTTAGSMYALGDGALKNDTEARVRYQHACDYGDNAGCVDLGIMYESIGEVEKAFTLYQTACVGKYPRGCTSMGVMYASGRGVARDDERAFKKFFETCRGDKETQGCANLGIMYENGRGTMKDEKEAATIYRDACEAGAAESCTLLGRLFDTGRGVAEETSKAVELFGRGCNGNDAFGCEQLAYANLRGHGVPQDEGRALKLFETACDRQNKTCTGLGDLYAQGRATAKNEKKAFELYDRACRANDPIGCDRQSQFYIDGRGVTKDLARGEVLARLACNGAIATSCTRLGTLTETNDPATARQSYEKGCDGKDGAGCAGIGVMLAAGTSRDEHKKAADFFKRGCDLGHAGSCNDLGVSYDDGSGVPLDPTKAAQLFDGACKSSNNVAACANLGFAYVQGRGVKADPATAMPLLDRACTGKIGAACTTIGFLSEAGIGTTKDATKANASYAKGCQYGDARACTYQGLLEQDATRATVMLKKSCDAKDQLACTFLADIYTLRPDLKEPPATATKLYTSACEAGIAAACTNLAMVNGTGLNTDVKANFEKGCAGADAFACARLDTMFHAVPTEGPMHTRCDHGDVRACVLFAEELLKSDVPGEHVKAFALLDDACAAGSTSGCRRMAHLYESQSAGLPAQGSANAYWEKACRLSDADACMTFATALDHDRTEPVKVADFYLRACDGGNAESCIALGLMYQNGRGVPRDGLHAALFYKRACEASNGNACLHLSQMYASGTLLEHDEEKADTYHKRACTLGIGAACH
ncbi:MAG: hypothetical protein QM831_45780 [Kofleriaceae bacterium]